MFEIEVHYRETDSFDSYERRDSLGVVLHDLEEARDCLQSAKDNYAYDWHYVGGRVRVIRLDKNHPSYVNY